MSGKRAKKIRKNIYGDYSIRFRKYYRVSGGNRTIVADDRRRRYQKAKRS